MQRKRASDSPAIRFRRRAPAPRDRRRSPALRSRRRSGRIGRRQPLASVSTADRAADVAGSSSSGSRPRSVGRSRCKVGALQPPDQLRRRQLILGPVDCHRHRDHGIDPVRRMTSTWMADPGPTRSLRGDRSGDVTVEDGISGVLEPDPPGSPQKGAQRPGPSERSTAGRRPSVTQRTRGPRPAPRTSTDRRRPPRSPAGRPARGARPRHRSPPPHLPTSSPRPAGLR